MPEKAAIAPKRVKSLLLTNLEPSEFRLTEYAAQAEEGTPWDRVLASDFWGNCTSRLRRGNRIIVTCENPPWFVELLVREASPTFVAVALLRHLDLPAPAHASDGDEGLPNGHSIKFLGPAELWAVLRGTQVLKKGLQSKGAAVSYLHDLSRVGAT